MRTGLSLTVCRSLMPPELGSASRGGGGGEKCLLPGGGCLLQGGVCFWGVSALGGCCFRGVSALGWLSASGGVCFWGVCLLPGGVCCWGWGVSASRGGCLLQGCVCFWGVSAREVVFQHALRQIPLLTESQTQVKMHSSRMHTTHPLTYGRSLSGEGESLSGGLCLGVSV